jgi:hypothetical protein
MCKKLFILPFLMLLLLKANSQEIESLEKSAIYKFERSFYISLNSNGWAFGGKFHKFRNGFNKRTLDFSFSTVKSPKQYRSQPPFINGRSYYYGKTNFFYLLRSTIGNQKLVSIKPLWGGVELRLYYQLGFGLGISKPVYVQIADENLIVSPERYDPFKHDWQDIYGAAPFTMGFDEIKLHPGLSAKTSLDFEFGGSDQQTNSLEIGLMADFFLIPYEIMGDDGNRFHLISLFFAFHFGSRFNK